MKSVANREEMHETWEECNLAYNKAKENLKDQGFEVHDVTIDSDALNKFWIEKGLIK